MPRNTDTVRFRALPRGKKIIPVLFASLVIAALTSCGSKQSTDSRGTREVRVAAAADLQYAFGDILQAFEAKHPDIRVAVTFGSSGNFFAQLSNGAPFDLFLSADQDYPRRLVESGLANQDSTFVYAIGHLVLWAPNRSALDLERLKIGAVADPAVKKLAIANPKHAPYGRAAEAALKKLGALEAARDKLVFGDNVAQTAQFVESGSADLGIFSLSLALAPPLRAQGRFWKIPQANHPPLEQAGVIMQRAQDRAAAFALQSFLTGVEGRGILKRFGFDLPGE